MASRAELSVRAAGTVHPAPAPRDVAGRLGRRPDHRCPARCARGYGLHGDDLRRAGYSDRVIAALDRLTHRDGEAYETYIERLDEDALARQVKLADLADNLANNRRLADVSASLDVQARITRYERALARLRAAPAADAEPPR